MKSCVFGCFEEGMGKGGGDLVVLYLPIYRVLGLSLVILYLPIYGGFASFSVHLVWHCWGKNWQIENAPVQLLEELVVFSPEQRDSASYFCCLVPSHVTTTRLNLASAHWAAAFARSWGERGKGGFMIADSEGEIIQVRRWTNILTSSLCIFLFLYLVEKARVWMSTKISAFVTSYEQVSNCYLQGYVWMFYFLLKTSCIGKANRCSGWKKAWSCRTANNSE